MDQFTQRIIGVGVHQGDVDGVVLCGLFNQAISSKGIPTYLSSDYDPVFRYHRWQANLRILEIEEIQHSTKEAIFWLKSNVRFYWSSQYDKSTCKQIVSNTGESTTPPTPPSETDPDNVVILHRWRRLSRRLFIAGDYQSHLNLARFH